MILSVNKKSDIHFSSLIKSVTYLTLIFVLMWNCSDQKHQKDERIIIGIESDVQTINPMYAFSYSEGNLIDLLFMKPAIEIWNDSTGMIEFQPMLAEKWEWNDDHDMLRLYLRKDIFWSDSVPITADDIVYTFDVYSDPKVESRFFGQFKNFYALDDSQIDIKKTFKVISPTILEVYFRKDGDPSLLDINLEIIPKHIWSKYKKEDLPQAQANFEPITSGPFKLIKWEREALISLSIDSSSFLYNPDNIKEIIFKIVPDYKLRITQLKTGTIDIVDNIKSEDIDELKLVEKLNVISLRGRDYDYIGWNHIDPQEFQKYRIIPNKLFSSSNIRKALTYAINRQEIVETYLDGFGELCKGPVSPMFKSFYDSGLQTDDYNPQRAKEILKENGWEDKNGDGLLEKGKVEFSFDLYINTGNPRRNYVATIVKNNLKAVGIEANIQMLEMGAFVERLMKRDYAAWIAGWTIPIPIDLNPYWNSNKELGFLNFSSYQNKEKDEILYQLQQGISEQEKIELYKKLQSIFYEDEPVTFLYWFDNIIVYNKRISKINFSMLGLVKNAWEWRVD
ncbi:MAG: ABC transporter substrate-binding protein [Ignavibacteriaceae bacterium]|nr:ABC transporter substrate-binding protein [Ignavibacteriaceae bacterium]